MLVLRILPLFVVLLVGFGAGWAGVFPSVKDAIASLNRYTLYIAAPLLIFGGMASPELVLPSELGFYLAHVVSLALVVVCVRIAGTIPRLRPHMGTLALCTVYGNITYLGIPLIERAFGAQAFGLASLSSGIHSFFAMTLGPALFLMWNGHDENHTYGFREVVERLRKQPMVWAPFAGLVARLLPDGLQGGLVDYTLVLGMSAGPVAIFMLGLYLWERREVLRKVRAPAIAISLLKLAVFPALALAVVLGMRGVFDLTEMEAMIVATQASMPVAVTTWSIAEEFDLDRDTVASAAILTSMLALITIPVVMSIAAQVLGISGH